MESINNYSTLEQRFAEDCKVIETKAEYEGYTGDEKYVIASDLTEEELVQKYGILLECYKPYVLVSIAYIEIRDAYRKNEHKHSQRIRRGSQFSVDDDFCEHHPENAVPDFTISLLEAGDSRVQQAIETLPPAEKRRIRKRYFDDYSNREIAAQEGVSEAAISQSLSSAEKKIKKLLFRP